MTKTTMQAEVPQTEMEVIYVTSAGKRHILVQPDGDTIRIGENTHTIPAEAITWNAGKGRKGPCCIVREGVTQAIPIHKLDREGPGPREFDNAAHTDLLRQLNSLAKDNAPPPIHWPTLIAIGIVGLISGGGLFALHGNIADLQKSVAASNMAHAQPDGATLYNGATTTTTTGGLRGVSPQPGG